MGIMDKFKDMANIKKQTRIFVDTLESDINEVCPNDDKCGHCNDCRERSQQVIDGVKKYFQKFL